MQSITVDQITSVLTFAVFAYLVWIARPGGPSSTNPLLKSLADLQKAREQDEVNHKREKKELSEKYRQALEDCQKRNTAIEVDLALMRQWRAIMTQEKKPRSRLNLREIMRTKLTDYDIRACAADIGFVFLDFHDTHEHPDRKGDNVLILLGEAQRHGKLDDVISWIRRERPGVELDGDSNIGLELPDFGT
jgi:hypothetical protein